MAPPRVSHISLIVRLDIANRDPNECWNYEGALTRGYGIVDTRGKTKRVHRAVYEEMVGPVADGAVLDHLCRNRRCFNPGHVEPVSSGENVLRGVGISAANARKTHCAHGHEFTPENTYRYEGRGKRERACKTCIANNLRRSRAARKSA